MNTSEDGAVLIFFPFLSLLGTFLTMIFYIMVPSANASPVFLGKTFFTCSSSLIYIFTSHIDFYTEY